MAAQSINNSIVNYDSSSISGLLNGEAITLNNSTMTMNSDVRWGQQAAVFGSITISPEQSGILNIDATQTKWIAFDASSGNVPSLGTVNVNDVTGSIAGVGEFLGVWTALGTVPLTAGSAIPSSGFIKLRSSSVAFVDNEVMTLSNGATVTINGAPQVGWIHLVGAEGGTFTVPRLGQWTSRGDWFELGTTNGTDDQIFQYPVTDCCPAFQMETSVGSGVYEWWLNSGARWGTATQFVSTDERGKYFGMDNATGIITIARRATNACGFKPVSGLKVRIPNIICSSSTVANWNANTINVTPSTRYDFSTAASGTLDIESLCGNWYLSIQSSYSLKLKKCSLLENMLLTNTATITELDNIGVGLNNTVSVSTVISMANMYGTTSLKNMRCCIYSSANFNGSIYNIGNGQNILFENCVGELFGAAATTERGVTSSYNLFISGINDIEIKDCSTVTGGFLISGSNRINISNYKYAERLNGTTTASIAISALTIQSSNFVAVDGVSYLFPTIANLHPYVSLLAISSCTAITAKNIGTSTSNFSGGSANQMGVFSTISSASNVDIRRCYFENLRTGLFTLQNTARNLIIDNVWGDGVDSQVWTSLGTTVRGGRFLPPTGSGQNSVYGTHWTDSFQSTTRGMLQLICNEPLATTTSQAVITAGTPRFSATGSLQMPNIGDQVTWEMPYFALGHTKLGGSQFTDMNGTGYQNMDYEYQIDTGLGYSVWKHLLTMRTRTSGGTAGTNTFVYTSVTGRQPQIGDYVGTSLGTNFSNNTTITNVVGTTITLSSNILVSLSAFQIIYFWSAIESEPAINPVTGFKLKVRVTTTVSNIANALQNIRIATATNSTDQQIQYPLPVIQNEAKIVGIETGSRIRVYNVTTATEIANEVMATTEWSLSYDEGSEFTEDDIVQIRITKVDGVTAYLPFQTLALSSITGWAALASQELDEVYNTNAIDGSLVTGMTADYPNMEIDFNIPSGSTTIQEIYAWTANDQTTINGIRYFFESMIAEDLVNYKLPIPPDLELNNTISTPLMITGGRVYTSDGSTVIASASNSIQIDPDKAYGIEIGTSGLTTAEAATLSKIDTLTEIAGSPSGLRFTAKALEEAPTPIPSDFSSDLLDSHPIETGFTMRESLRLALSALSGKLSGAGTTEIVIRDVNDTVDRIIATVDANGNRTSVTLNKD